MRAGIQSIAKGQGYETKKANGEQVLVKKIDANKMLRFYRLAQDAYSKKTYDISLSYIDSSMFYGESSDALGLKGSVYFTKGEVELAKRVWEQAKVIDKDFKVPVINQKYIRK